MKHGYGIKMLACCMAVVLACACLPFAAAAEPAAYTGTVLMALNTNRRNTFANFATDRDQEVKPVEAAAEPAQEKMLPDGPLDDPEPLSGPQSLLRQAEVGDVEPQAAAEYRVGDTKQIYSHYAVSEGKEYRRVDVVCTSVGETVTVWRERGTENDHVEDDRKLAADLDERLPKELEFFGDKRIDTDGDGKMAVFQYEIDGENIGGYFTVVDLIDKFGRVGSVWYPSLSTSNHMDCIHVQGHSSYSFAVETCLHEYQHYIQASYRFVGRNNFTVLKAPEKYVNEGFSTAAEYLLYGVDRYSDDFAYAARPSKGLSFLNWKHDNGNYSMAFVFSQYIRTRYAAMTNDLDSEIPGGGVYKTILEARTPKNDDDTMAIVADMLYPANAYPELRDSEARCRQLLFDFWMAVFCQEPEGVHGFNGEKWAKWIEVRDLVQPMPAGGTEYPIRSGMAAFYQIPTNETDSVRVTGSDSVLTFSVPAAKGYTLRFDANGGTGAPEARILRETYEVWDVPYRSGYTFLGWALTPDASSARYNSVGTIRLTADTTLYAVWQAAPDVVTDTAYPIRRQGGEETNNYRFVPQADGVYKLTVPSRYTVYLYRNGEEIPPDWYYLESGEEIAYFSLTGNTAYDLNIGNIRSYAYGSFTLAWQETCYTLTYRFDHPLVDETWAKTGETTYTVEKAYPRGGVRFLGWAYTPDAEKPEVLPDSELTLTQDTTLYAVCAPEDVLPTDGSYVQATKDFNAFLYVLRPEQDGTYELRWTPDPETIGDYSQAWLLDGHGQTLMEAEPDTASACALRGGETYYLLGSTDSLIVTATCKKTSDRIKTVLKFSVGKNACFDLKLRGKTTFVVPDYTPAALDGRRFLGWTDETTGEIRNPGDTIRVVRETVLTAKWSDAPEETREITQAVKDWVPNFIRALWQWISLRITDAFTR